MDEILIESSGDYYMDVREFQSGAVEVVVKAIRPMHEGSIRSVADPLSYSNACKALGESSSTSTTVRFKSEPEEVSEWDKLANHRRAVRRAKQNIRWCVMQMRADRLFTVTYRENVEDRERVKGGVKRFIRLVRKGWGEEGGIPDWRYVAVLEKQDRGAYHVHFAVKGWQRVSYLRKCWAKAIGGTGLERGADTLGNVDVTSPRKARWGTELMQWRCSKLAAYLVKYLSKTFDEKTFDKRRYWHSKDLKVPVRQRFMLCAVDMVTAIREAMDVIFSRFGHAIDFSRSWVAASGDLLWLTLGET